ncbi:colicin V synthesis protein [Pantoea agglomerans]|uniref:colicin V synthesis protein n=1 Tax=Enterobacter agglomerans TaxID=549 RepID=UPI0018783152|nr:colicin V synthesis protein [Pantoea agglomerans]MBE5683329.1 colicin V synthesis protein [Pantoea agglomerans]
MMRTLNSNEFNSVSGAYGENLLANVAEGIACSIGGAVLGSWTLAILGGRGASSADVIGIGGGITALVGMIGGAIAGAAAGAVYGPYVGWDAGLVVAQDLIGDLMKGLPGA